MRESLRASWIKALALPLLTALAVAGASAAPASAGTFEVLACDAAGGAQRSWSPAASSDRVGAYSVCPTGGIDSSGILTRNAVYPSGGNGAFGDIASQTFTAPPGTTIAGVSASYDFFKNTGSGWVTGLVAQVGPTRSPQRLIGCYVQNATCATRDVDKYIAAPPDTRALYVETYCESSFCPLETARKDGSRNNAQASARLFSARVVLQDDSAPTLGGLGGSLLTGGWKRGAQTVSFDATDNVGIRETSVNLGRGRTAKLGDCDDNLVVPCPQGPNAYDFDTRTTLMDGELTLLLDAVDSAGNRRTAERTVAVDNSAPPAPQAAAIDGGEGWRASNSFRVTWRNPTETGVAPIAGAELELCPIDGGPCTREHRDGRNIEVAQDIKLPAPGDFVLRLCFATRPATRIAAWPPNHCTCVMTARHRRFPSRGRIRPTLVSSQSTCAMTSRGWRAGLSKASDRRTVTGGRSKPRSKEAGWWPASTMRRSPTAATSSARKPSTARATSGRPTG